MASPSAPGPSTASAVPTSSLSPGPCAASSALTGLTSLVHTGTDSSLEISDNVKRWVVVGIGMHSVLLPALLNVVQEEISQFYLHLKSSQNIDTQVSGAYMKKDGSFQLNYESINNNKKGKLYDYKVTSPEDLGKLYLQPHMAKFTGFDNTCDLSAVLGILANASVFQRSVQDNAKDVRSQVRNEWGHCNFDHWGEIEFTNCFNLMKTLVSSLKLPSEKEVCSDLLKWEENGLQLCFDGPLNKDLVKLVIDRVANLEVRVNELGAFSADQAKKISGALQNVRCEFDKLREKVEKLEERVEKEEERMENLEERVEKEEERMENLEERVGRGEERIEKGNGRVDRLEERVDKGEAEMRGISSRCDELEATVSSIKDSRNICYVTNSAKAVPFQVPSQNPYFCGRDSELEAITAHFKGTKRGCAQSAICGLGGVGKTSLAVEYLWRHREDYKDGIFWVSGESDTLFEETFGDLAKLLGTFVKGDFRETLKETIRYLQRREHVWCLVVDNLDLQNLTKNMSYLLQGKWKQGAHAHIIITTRRVAREISELVQMEERCCVALNCLTMEGSIQFLRKRTDKPEGEESEIRKLIMSLGALPLALEQAARYITRVGCSFEEYVKQYEQEKLRLLEKGKERGVEVTERSAVHTTWLLIFEHIRNYKHYEKSVIDAAILIMEVSAFLQPDDIPFEIINCGDPQVDVESGIVQVLKSPLKRLEILDLLTNFSLFQRRGKTSFSVHRLVQEVIREELVKDRVEFVLCCAKRLIVGAEPHRSARLTEDKSSTELFWGLMQLLKIHKHLNQISTEKLKNELARFRNRSARNQQTYVSDQKRNEIVRPGVE